MTKRTDVANDPWDAAFAEETDGERLRQAFAEELDRPGLEGPSYDAVLRSGTARRRRRRATLGATFAAVSVTGVAAAVLATGLSPMHQAETSDAANFRAAVTFSGGAAAPSSAPALAAGTTLAAAGSVGSSGSSGSSGSVNSGSSGGSVTSTGSAAVADGAAPADAAPYPPEAVLAAGTLGGHRWQLVRRYTPNVSSPIFDVGAPTSSGGPQTTQWCGELDIVVDGVTTNSGNGNTPCLTVGRTTVPVVPPDPAAPGVTALTILEPNHGSLGEIVAGSVSPVIVSVTAQCGSKTSTVTTTKPSGDVAAYYSFTFPGGSSCQSGALAFFDASGSQTASVSGVEMGGGK